MCGGVEYEAHGDIIRTYFPKPKATLPVLRKDGEIEPVIWGRREQELDQTAEPFPVTGWARQATLTQRNGFWQRFQTKPVKICVHGFMEKDGAKQSHWFKLSKHEAIEGLLVMARPYWRVYVVTEDAPTDPATLSQRMHAGGHQDDMFANVDAPAMIHDRWPKIISL
ncbi:MAG: hypothetical protein RI556_12650 [Hydrogenovibrio sp.]|uniref:hypothetical protein n=1 Tax=Hydrogenovibrio sp. TaxID=2065821 RepID=UPI0028703710|nr:hypothetical protein [Hydrogenovibrio sp.]MDR9500019.1 hypothetical protein [Hydrogenovibrio sp.]